MNIKSNVLKSVFAAGLALTGVAAIGLGTNGQADAATIGDSVTVDYIDGQSIATWSNYYTATVTGSVKDGSSWKVVKTARDASGEKWYKIGNRQWIMAKYTTEASTASNSTYNANTTSTTSSTGTGYTTSYSSSANNYGYGSNYNYSYSANTGAANTSSYSASTTSSSTSASTSTASASTSSSTSTSTASASTSSSTSTSSSSSEEAAKAWIASKESGGSYTASNGNYYGKYQLSLSYLNGDTSAANQEKVANSYVQSRYGSWTAAKAFWQANGWY
ncbi:aggregation-promoting factor [Lactobacillus delbrueckii]|uniref:aggregation-promoting factor n=1 Tax=Lactobacillus delbrueckii TaxID=1584 RepID=UPI001E3D296B|nr:aggregation promoting factor [Lactobacillus delbrueckii]MCD5515413.1 aggregation promoting factor [Lactobacillus delbrueckii subsp. lactis]MCD5521237.1 aggregation promoting factor [Lactobacillus delbrueckii subsp. lactis]MCT3484177.1 aggregation promoting factor [Lactobacillus delbrueckii subsp. lactis]MCT3488821.1 aggregation promoting factor [Lactobacillus delbrueckii subsp. lactis]